MYGGGSVFKSVYGGGVGGVTGFGGQQGWGGEVICV